MEGIGWKFSWLKKTFEIGKVIQVQNDEFNQKERVLRANKEKKKRKKRCNDEFFMIKVKMSLDSIHLFFFILFPLKLKLFMNNFLKIFKF